MEASSKVMEENNIGYTFWPYKKMGGSCFVSVDTPDHWELVVAFSEAPQRHLCCNKGSQAGTGVEPAIHDGTSGVMPF